MIFYKKFSRISTSPYITIYIIFSFDIISSTIDSYLQKSVDVRYQCSNRYFSVNLVYGVPSTFHRMTGIEDLLNEGIVDSIHYHKTPGSVITDDRASGGRIAAILISGDTRQDVLDKVKITFERINAFDSNGNQILRKDLYIKQ